MREWGCVLPEMAGMAPATELVLSEGSGERRKNTATSKYSGYTVLVRLTTVQVGFKNIGLRT